MDDELLKALTIFSNPGVLLTALAWAFVFGMWLGMAGRDRRWREKGDHDYMNTMASGKHLYHVKRKS